MFEYYNRKRSDKIKKYEISTDGINQPGHIDHNRINRTLITVYIFRAFKLVLTIFITSYFVGLFWYIICNTYAIYILEAEHEEEERAAASDLMPIGLEGNMNITNTVRKDHPQNLDEVNDFITYFKIDDGKTYKQWDRAIVMTYYAFTSLSTVGFGDYHPRNEFERVVCAILLLVGNALFGYIVGDFN